MASAALQLCTRDDVVSRLGGDEFATQLIDRALSGRDPDHYRIVLLEWATALEMLLASEGGKKGEAAALRLQERIESARSAILAA